MKDKIKAAFPYFLGVLITAFTTYQSIQVKDAQALSNTWQAAALYQTHEAELCVKVK